MNLNSFNELLNKVENQAKAYLISQVESFFRDIIEPTKSELLTFE